jgi:hypothetical protein
MQIKCNNRYWKSCYICRISIIYNASERLWLANLVEFIFPQRLCFDLTLNRNSIIQWDHSLLKIWPASTEDVTILTYIINNHKYLNKYINIELILQQYTNYSLVNMFNHSASNHVHRPIK